MSTFLIRIADSLISCQKDRTTLSTLGKETQKPHQEPLFSVWVRAHTHTHTHTHTLILKKQDAAGIEPCSFHVAETLLGESSHCNL